MQIFEFQYKVVYLQQILFQIIFEAFSEGIDFDFDLYKFIRNLAIVNICQEFIWVVCSHLKYFTQTSNIYENSLDTGSE